MSECVLCGVELAEHPHEQDSVAGPEVGCVGAVRRRLVGLYEPQLAAAQAQIASLRKRAELAETRLEIGAAFGALSRAARDVKSGDPRAPRRMAAAQARIDLAEATLATLTSHENVESRDGLPTARRAAAAFR
jgi:hypothetical protein